MKQFSNKQTIMFLIFLILMWGLNWPLTKIGLIYAPPLLFAGIRTFLGGLILLLLFTVKRYKHLHFQKYWHIYILAALLNIVFYYGLMTLGLMYMPAGIFSSIVFLQPVLLGLFSWLWLNETMSTLKAIGLILGFLGVAIISVAGVKTHASLLGIMLAFGTALSWTFGTLFMKKTSTTVDPFCTVSLQLIIGGLFLIAGGSIVESWSTIQINAIFICNLLFISIFVIGIGWLIYFTLISDGEVSKIGAYTFMIPVISNITSILFLNEKITINLLVGLFLIFISIIFVNKKAVLVKEQTVTHHVRM